MNEQRVRVDRARTPITDIDRVMRGGIRMAEADQLFQTLEAPEIDQLAGLLPVRLVASPVGDRLPPRMARVFVRLVNLVSRPFYRGKRFDELGDSGVNVWLRSRDYAYFAVERREPLTGDVGGTRVVVHYDLDQNPPRVRPIFSEVRTLAPGYYLCRMMVWSRTDPRTLLYFSLQS